MRFARLFAIVGVVLLAATVSWGEVLVNYNPTGSGLEETTDIAPGFTAYGLTASSLAHSNPASGVNDDVWPNHIVLGPLDTTDYVSFTLTPVGGPATITSIEWDGRTYCRNTTVNLAVRTSLDGFSSNVATAGYFSPGYTALQSMVLDTSSLPAVSSPIEFRLYFYGSTDCVGDWSDLVSTNQGGTGMTVNGTATAPPAAPTISRSGFVVLITALAIAGVVALRSRAA